MAPRFLAPFFVLALQAAVPGALAQEMALALGNGMAAYGAGYARPSVHVAGGIATVSGVGRIMYIMGPSMGNYISLSGISFPVG